MKNSIRAGTLASFNTSGLTTSYKALNSAGLQGPAVLLCIYNASNVDVTISYDGATDHDIIPNGKERQFNFQNNATPNSNAAMMKKGTIVWVKGAGSGSGSIHLSAYYLAS